MYLFPNLSGCKSGAQNLAFWKEVWAECGPSSDWAVHWGKQNGKDPILKAVNKKDGVGLRVLQFAPPTDSPDFEAYMSKNKDLYIAEELVIAVAPSEENILKVKTFIKKWIGAK